MNRRDMLMNLAHGDGTAPMPYIPAAFFLHFDANSRVGTAAVSKHKEFFRATNMDFVKIQYELPFPQQTIQKPEDWKQVRALDAEFFAPQLNVVRGLVCELKKEAPVIVTLYSPFMCAGQIAGSATLHNHLEEDPDSVAVGMEVVTESLRVFVQECIKLGVDGFYHSTQGGEGGRFSRDGIFEKYIKPYDLSLMKLAEERCQFNILHICDYHRSEYGSYPDLTPYLEYPGHIVNCSLDIGKGTMPPCALARLFNRPFMGGMDRKGTLSNGTVVQVKETARAILMCAPDRYIFGADCTVPNSTPWQNLRAAVDSAHRFRESGID